MPNALTYWAIRARHLLSHVVEYWPWRYRYCWSKVNIWNVNCARATAFIFDTRTGVLGKVSNFLRQKIYELRYFPKIAEYIMLTFSNGYFTGLLRPIWLKHAQNPNYVMQSGTECTELCVTRCTCQCLGAYRFWPLLRSCNTTKIHLGCRLTHLMPLEFSPHVTIWLRIHSWIKVKPDQ